ncbi:MAG TPA: tRNA pseudouridine(55) synthase TruB [Methylomirabilota bacterium]|jgi:tRNA pseudouridine55 synthase|nr:tRNA pseudouridine(55) synthase TruB [Methylomirabilota bacterium]
MTDASGILVVDKAAGATSFDAVALARRRLGVRRIGHAGTLDPPATGVLPLLVGEATKLTPYLMDQDKEYVAIIRFGVTTDTQDLSGRVLSETPVTGLTRARVESAAGAFVGRITQVPPMYSAIHHEGRRLYELAREGLEVERAPREVLVVGIEVQDVGAASATLRIVCGKGTYVRALAADLGAALGWGAAVERLARTRVGPFALRDAVAWAELEDGAVTDLWPRVLPLDAALTHWPSARLDASGAKRFRHGQAADVAPPVPAGGLVRVYDQTGALLGVGEADATGRSVRPVRMVHADHPGTSVRPA